MIKIFFHPDFLSQYTTDPAASPGRLEPALAVLQRKYSVVEPGPAGEQDILLVHTKFHLQQVSLKKPVYHTAMLSAGAVIEAATGSLDGQFCFALCRPPGHHASPDSCWGFCYFNNVAIAVKKLLKEGLINSALIVDFDLHYGDGTANSFQGESSVAIWDSREADRLLFITSLESCLQRLSVDLVAVSAGFDRHLDDWGGMLTTEDYGTIGRLLGRFARENCGGRLFAALEGGYNADALAAGIEAFLEGLEE